MTVNTIKSPLDFDNFDILKSGDGFFPAVSVSSPGAGNYVTGNGTTTIAHGLGFTPILQAFLQDAATGMSYPLPVNKFIVNTSSQAAFYGLICYADQNNLYLLTELVAYGAAFSITASAYQCQFYMMRERIKRAI